MTSQPATAADELLQKMVVARKAALRPLAQYFMQALQQRGLHKDESTDWAARMLQAWVRAGLTLEAAQRRYILVCGKGGAQEAVEESLWFALQGASDQDGGNREAVRMAAKMGADYLSKTKEARLGARYLKNAKGAVAMTGFAAEDDDDDGEADALAADLMASVASKFAPSR